MTCTDSIPHWLDYLPPTCCQDMTYILHLGIRAFQQETRNSACDGDRGPGFMARYIYAAIVDPNELGATPSLYGYVNRIGNEPYDWHRYHSTGASHLWR